MWSVPPAEPPAIAFPPGSSAHAVVKSSSVSYGESAGTTITSDSPVRRAIGVTSSSVTAWLLVSIAPSMTRPIVISRLSSVSRSSWPSPITPPAPSTLKTCTLRTSPERCSACCMTRLVVSQPPPGLAGAMIRIRLRSPACTTVPAHPAAGTSAIVISSACAVRLHDRLISTPNRLVETLGRPGRPVEGVTVIRSLVERVSRRGSGDATRVSVAGGEVRPATADGAWLGLGGRVPVASLWRQGPTLSGPGPSDVGILADRSGDLRSEQFPLVEV